MPTSSNADFLQQWRHALAPYTLGYKIKLVSQLMYRDFLEQLKPYGITPFHYVVLCCLWEEDGLSASGIADKLKQLGATLTGVVDRMEERKLVYRERDPDDRRIVRIWLSAEGKRLTKVLPAVSVESSKKATVGISEVEQEAILQLLDQVVHNLL